jgi:hypothetical protein
MARTLDTRIARAARAEARRLEAEAASYQPHPEGMIISRPNRTSRKLNGRLTGEQFTQIQNIAERRHPPMSTKWPAPGS